MRVLDYTSLMRELSAPIAPIPTGEAARLQKLSNIKAVVFDVYGTLLCSGVGDITVADNEDREPALRATLNKHGWLVDGVEDRLREPFLEITQRYRDRIMAKGIDYAEVDIVEVWKQFLNYLCDQHGVCGLFDATSLELLAMDYEARVNPAWPMPGAMDALQRLRERGTMLGIVSNAQFFTPYLLEGLCESTLAKLGFHRQLCVWSYEHCIAKPSVRLYEILEQQMHLLGISPGEVLYVGNDMRNDIWPAQKVGFKTALFAGDARSLRWRSDFQDVAKVQPDCVIVGFEQLFDII